jgi:hypothetical protein
MSLETLQTQDGISESCKAAISALLPSPQTSATGKLMSLGSSEDPITGETVIYLQGFSIDGSALDLADLEQTKAVLVTGTEEEQVQATVEVVPPDELILSVSFVTDYSASMADPDLDTVTSMYSALTAAIPCGYEGQSIIFSDAVTMKQDFTTDNEALSAALARDTAYERGSTALYDGMGTGATALSGRALPARLLVVATDGLENASTQYTREQVASAVRDGNMGVVMIGTLFSDLEELSYLQGPNGVFFYASDFEAAQELFQVYVNSMESLVEVRVPPNDADEVRLEVGELELTVVAQ